MEPVKIIYFLKWNKVRKAVYSISYLIISPIFTNLGANNNSLEPKRITYFRHFLYGSASITRSAWNCWTGATLAPVTLR